MTFQVPDFAFGDGRGFRVTASQVAHRHSGYVCRMGLALTARQRAGRLQPNDQSRWRGQFDRASTLHFAVRDLTFALARGEDVAAALAGNEELTHSQRRFLSHALDLLGELLPAVSASCGTEMRLDDELSVTTHLDDLAGEVTVFGRHLRSADGGTHEVVRMRLRELRRGRAEDADWTAVAALTLAYAPGVPPAARVRVSELSLADGEYRVAFDGGRADAVALYERQARPLRDALDGGPFSPGQACSGCAFLNVCPAVPQRRGVLGIPGRAVATRYVTSADLHAYDRCPTAFLAQRRDHLPDAYLDDADRSGSQIARDRGVAVQTWLTWAHSRSPARACTEADLPAPDDPAAAAAALAAGLEPDAYRVAYPYLLQHLGQCPCGLDGLEGWTPEPRVVLFDPDADMVVISTPDLTCVVTGSAEPVWRETKTSSSVPRDLEEALWRYPAFALDVAILAADVPSLHADAHAELEVLTPTGGEVFYVSVSEGAVVALAQRIVADIARRYAADVTFDRQPNGGCRTCSVHRWCDPPLTPADVAAAAPVLDDDEFAGLEDPF